MPDITMCNNNMCYKRNDCYRFTAKPSEKQSYTHFIPLNDCFISNKKDKNIERE